MRTLPVLGLTFCITWNLATLLRGVFTLRPVYQAWLKHLFVTLSRNLVILFLVVLVVSVMTITIILVLPLEVGAMVPFRPSVVTVVTSITLFCCMADLLIKPLAKLMTHIASDALLDLAFALLCQ
jgi:hypothetical protein